MKPPRNTKELKTFLGFIQYLGKFMPNMATVSAPLRELLEKNIAWHWEQEQEASFERLKQIGLVNTGTWILRSKQTINPIS